MKIYHTVTANFQIILDALVFVRSVLFDKTPAAEIKPFVFISPFSETREKMLLQAAKFELKKRGLKI